MAVGGSVKDVYIPQILECDSDEHVATAPSRVLFPDTDNTIHIILTVVRLYFRSVISHSYRLRRRMSSLRKHIYWHIKGRLAHWHITHWHIGILAHWHIGTLAHWQVSMALLRFASIAQIRLMNANSRVTNIWQQAGSVHR